MIIRNSLITASMRMGDDHLLLQYPEGWWAPDQMRNGAINALPKNRGNWELTRLKKKQTLLCWSGELICLDSQNTLKNGYLIRTYYIIDFNTLLPIRLHGCTLELAAGIWCSALELGTFHIYIYIPISQYHILPPTGLLLDCTQSKHRSILAGTLCPSPENIWQRPHLPTVCTNLCTHIIYIYIHTNVTNMTTYIYKYIIEVYIYMQTY